MPHSSKYLILLCAGLIAFLSYPLAASDNEGRLFPPKNYEEGKCTPKSFLQWDTNGGLICVEGILKSDIPTCESGKFLSWNGTKFSCESGIAFGGFYQLDDYGYNSPNSKKNQFTGGFSCPAGYKAYWFGRVKAPETGWGAVQVYCYK